MGLTVGSAILTWAGVTEFTVATATIVGDIAITVATTAISYGLNAALAPNLSSEPTRQQINTRQAIPPRRRYYGKCKAGGIFAFIRSNNGDLFQVILIAGHEIEFLEHWIGDRQVTVSGSGNVTAPASMIDDTFHRFHIFEKSGSDTQTAHATLVTKFPTLWTADHRLLGIANVLFKQDSVEAKKLSRFYPGGPQAYRAVFNGARVWDVNDGAQDPDDETTWDFGHDNAANVIRDFLTHRDGYHLPASAISLDDFETAATACDVLVSKKGGGTIPRYRIAGGYDLTAPPKDTLAKMLAACDGQIFMKANGTVGLKVGVWDAPTVTLDDAHIRPFSLPKGLGPLRQANEIRASYTDPERDFQPVEAVPWRDGSDIVMRGEVLSSSIDLSFVPHHNQARRLMKIAAMRANPERSGTITTDLYGMNALGERRMHVTIAKRNIDIDSEVTSFSIDVVNKACTIGVSAVTGDAYTFNAASEEGNITSSTDTSNDNTIDPPGNFTVTATSGSRIHVECDPPDAFRVLSLHTEYSVQSSGVWTGILIPEATFEGISSVLIAGTYDVRGWFTGPQGAASDYVNVTGVVVGSVSAPTSPMNLNAANASGTVTVDWDAPNDTNVYACRVWRGTAAFGAATDITGQIFCSPNQALSYADTPGTGTWKYWVTAESVTGAQSTEAGPATVVV